MAARLATSDNWISRVSGVVAEAIIRELPEVASKEELRRATHAGAEGNIRLLIEFIRTGADPVEAEPPPAAVQHARELVRQGVAIDTLLRTYSIGQASCLEEISRAAREALEDPQELSHALQHVARVTLAYVNAVSRVLVERYAQERDNWVRSAVAVRADTVRALLAGDPLDLSAAELRLGYTLPRFHLGFVVWSASDDESFDDLGALERIASGLAMDLGGTHPLLVPFGAHLIAGWVGGREAHPSGLRPTLSVDPQRGPAAWAAIGTPGSGVEGFARSYREAMQARRIAELMRRRPGSVFAYEDVALAALASADLEHARDFVLRQLGPLAADDDATVRVAATLRVYLEEGSRPRRAAERLGVHPNTIAYRIQAAEEMLGHPIESRVAELLVALRLAPVVRDDG
ncbi:MAG: PucR family transcriptional regulator [Solirubrobacteraceae bacterium]